MRRLSTYGTSAASSIISCFVCVLGFLKQGPLSAETDILQVLGKVSRHTVRCCGFCKASLQNLTFGN